MPYLCCSCLHIVAPDCSDILLGCYNGYRSVCKRHILVKIHKQTDSFHITRVSSHCCCRSDHRCNLLHLAFHIRLGSFCSENTVVGCCIAADVDCSLLDDTAEHHCSVCCPGSISGYCLLLAVVVDFC